MAEATVARPGTLEGMSYIFITNRTDNSSEKTTVDQGSSITQDASAKPFHQAQVVG
jgi:hypothetical protein